MCKRASIVQRVLNQPTRLSLHELQARFEEECGPHTIGHVLIVGYADPLDGFHVVFNAAVVHGHEHLPTGDDPSTGLEDTGDEECEVLLGEAIVGIGRKRPDGSVRWNAPQIHVPRSPKLFLPGALPHAFASDGLMVAHFRGPWKECCVSAHVQVGGNSHPLLPTDRPDRCPGEFDTV